MTHANKTRTIIGSLRVKSLLFLFFTMLLASFLTLIVMFLSVRGRVHTFSNQMVEQRALFLEEIFRRSDISSTELVALYQKNFGEISLISSFSALPPLTGVIKESDIRNGVVCFSAERDFPHGVVRIGTEYLSLSPLSSDRELLVLRRMIIHTLLLFTAIASLCTIVTLRRAIRPLTRLNEAIGQVGRGDFHVHVEYRGRDEISHIVQNFNWMVEKLGQIEYLRRDFVSSVSHEFKTPLSAISGSAKLLGSVPREKLTEARVQKYTTLILDETARLTALSSNLLRLSKLENQNAAENLTTFSLDEQLRRSILLLENQWGVKPLAMHVQLEEIRCTGDEELLAQVWINLLSNAVKFTEKNGRITVGLRRSNTTAQIEIADTGSGMSRETISRLFEKFYQGDASHAREGSGLGLSIVKRILDLHGGGIQFESELGCGTTCRITLPLSQPNLG